MPAHRTETVANAESSRSPRAYSKEAYAWRKSYRTITYSSAFAAASSMLVAGVFAYFVLVKQVVPLEWRDPEPELQGVLG